MIYLNNSFSQYVCIEIGLRPTLYIKQHPNRVHGRMIQDGGAAPIQCRATRATMRSPGQVWRAQHHRSGSGRHQCRWEEQTPEPPADTPLAAHTTERVPTMTTMEPGDVEKHRRPREEEREAPQQQATTRLRLAAPPRRRQGRNIVLCTADELVTVSVRSVDML